MKATAYDTKWSPKGYLEQYYSGKNVTNDEIGILKFIENFFKDKKSNFTNMIEVGCGPTIHHLTPFISHVDSIYIADYVESNLEEIRRWVNNSQDAHDWTAYLSGALRYKMGRLPSKAKIENTINSLKSKITSLLKCDVRSKKPLGIKKTFNLVTSFYTLECVAHTQEEFVQFVKNLASLVKPNGWLILVDLHNANHYMVGDESFPTVRVTENIIRKSLTNGGFLPKTININLHPCPEYINEGFGNIVMSSAQKS